MHIENTAYLLCSSGFRLDIVYMKDCLDDIVLTSPPKLFLSVILWSWTTPVCDDGTFFLLPLRHRNPDVKKVLMFLMFQFQCCNLYINLDLLELLCYLPLNWLSQKE